jgi:Cu2+-exporting ATPase
VTESGIEKVPLAQLHVGDVVLVRPGSRVPADGIVVEGTAEVDESLISGESRAIPKTLGSGGRNGCGGRKPPGACERHLGKRLHSPASCDWLLPRKASGSRAQALADRAAALLFYVAVAAGTLTFVYWWVAGDRQHALIRTATVLVIACPHALGLAIPLVIAISGAIGAHNGLLVKDRLALERALVLNVVIFDKTRTLTRGPFWRRRRSECG